jgi:hypothetical protein
MGITEITVEVGEGRMIPHEYGNYRCSVRLTSYVDPVTQDPMVVVRQLRAQARFHAVEECDQWEEEVEEQKRVSDLLERLHDLLESIKGWGHTIEDVHGYRQAALPLIEELPEDMHDRWLQEIQDALDWRIEEMNVVDELCAAAEEGLTKDTVEEWELRHPVEPPF